MGPRFTLLPKTTKKNKRGWAPVTHICNPSYLIGRDQEDRSSKAEIRRIEVQSQPGQRVLKTLS
jgi:hypothetical protein